MSIRVDPAGVSARTIRDFGNLEGKSVLEVGCGDGRLTFPMAEIANHVTAIDPETEDIQLAIAETPDHLEEKIQFINTSIEDFSLPGDSPKFDLSIFTWSL